MRYPFAPKWTNVLAAMAAATLAAARSQGADLIQLVIYDLPGRDCAALASNGELQATDIDRYEHDYIDPIATILGDPAYANLRIVTVVEIDSIPNLVTNVTPRPTFTPQCDTMAANGTTSPASGTRWLTSGRSRT